MCQNAASDYVRFLHSSQWELLPFDDIYALDWRHPDDQISYWRHKARKCAEGVGTRVVQCSFLTGAYVIDEAAAERLCCSGTSLPVTINPMLFFR